MNRSYRALARTVARCHGRRARLLAPLGRMAWWLARGLASLGMGAAGMVAGIAGAGVRDMASDPAGAAGGPRGASAAVGGSEGASANQEAPGLKGALGFATVGHPDTSGTTLSDPSTNRKYSLTSLWSGMTRENTPCSLALRTATGSSGPREAPLWAGGRFLLSRSHR
jgi:hypothetical protein